MPTLGEMMEMFEECEEEQQESDLQVLERVNDQIWAVRSRLKALLLERQRLEKALGFPRTDD
jgi:hypothetical protein